MSAQLCLALDARDEAEIRRLAEITAEHVDVFKVGLTAFTSIGPRLVRSLATIRPVFLDLKLHDIPAQVAGAVRAAADTGATYVTVHASGGDAMLRAAVDAAPTDIRVLAVTVLTSLDDADLATIGIGEGADKTVLRLAELARGAGVPGLVCSPLEVEPLRARFGPTPEGPVLVVPGIRSAGGPADDQRRTMSPAEAARAGADLLVIGRPITGADDPVAAARALKEAIDERG